MSSSQIEIMVPTAIVSLPTTCETRKVGETKWETVPFTSTPMYGDLVSVIGKKTPFTSGVSSSHWLWAYGYKQMADPPNAPPAQFIKVGPEGVSNAPFERKSRNGAIVVSKYSGYEIKITYANGVLYRDGGTKVILAKDRVKCWQGSFPDSYTTISYGVRHGDREYRAFNGLLELEYTYIIGDTYVTPYDVGWNDGIVMSIPSKAFATNERTNALLWTTCLSEANAATVDILTAMAELPETVRSILSLLTSIAQAFKAAKKRELKLFERSKKVRWEAAEKVKRADFRSRQQYLAAKTAREKKNIQRKAIAERKRIFNDMKKALEDIASAISQVWLTYRYGIMPNVYLIEDLVEAMNKHDRVFREWRKVETVTFDPLREGHSYPSGWVGPRELDAHHRAFIKRRFDVAHDFSLYIKEMSANALVTAWELVPLSFVVDWVFNIGDYLSAMTGGATVPYVQACTQSVKFNETITFSHSESGARVVAHVTGYSRNVIDRPEKYCGILLSPHITQFRAFDALALSWSIFGKNFTKNLNLK